MYIDFLGSLGKVSRKFGQADRKGDLTSPTPFHIGSKLPKVLLCFFGKKRTFWGTVSGTLDSDLFVHFLGLS